jgi:spore maturation protein CgeB
MNKLRVLVVGDFVFPIYEKAFFDKFIEIEQTTEKFVISKYLSFNNQNIFLRNFYKAQYKFNIGPTIFKLNVELLKKVTEFSPDIIFVYRGKHIMLSTLTQIKQKFPLIKLFNYNNDDAFSEKYPSYFWKLYKRSIHHYDHVFCYRAKNIADLKNIGYFKSSLLLPYYIDKNNFKKEQKNKKRNFDVVFIGHFEDDGRDDCIKMLIEKGYVVGLFGTGWEESAYYRYFINSLGSIKRLDTVSYNETLNNSKTALVFMSKLNNDEYTRRCFEIPPTGAVMISERTPALMNLFKEDEEIIFFENKTELDSKLNNLFNDKILLKKMSTNALRRLLNDKHELTDRVNQIVETYFKL